MNKHSRESEAKADFETILARLEAKNEQLDREVESALKRAGLSRKVLELAGELARRCAPDRLARAKRELEARLSNADTSHDWSRISRPSVDQLTCNCGKQLMRV